KSRDYADCRMYLEAAADILGDAAPLKDRGCLRRAGTEENLRSAKGDPLTAALCVAGGGDGSSDTAPLDCQPINSAAREKPRPAVERIRDQRGAHRLLGAGGEAGHLMLLRRGFAASALQGGDLPPHGLTGAAQDLRRRAGSARG